MMMGPNNGDRAMSRPFVMGMIFLIVFMSMQSDWAPAQRRRPGDLRPTQQSPAQHRETVKEKIIHDLSVSNEKLEEEKRKLKLENFSLKRSLRTCRGEGGNDTGTEGEDAAALSAGGAAEGATAGGEGGAGAQLALGEGRTDGGGGISQGSK